MMDSQLILGNSCHFGEKPSICQLILKKPGMTKIQLATRVYKLEWTTDSQYTGAIIRFLIDDNLMTHASLNAFKTFHF